MFLITLRHLIMTFSAVKKHLIPLYFLLVSRGRGDGATQFEMISAFCERADRFEECI